MFKVEPEDFQRVTELVSIGLRTMARGICTTTTASLHVRFAARQAAICERLLTPLVLDLELRRGLEDLAIKADHHAPEKKAAAWLLKLLGEEPL